MVQITTVLSTVKWILSAKENRKLLIHMESPTSFARNSSTLHGAFLSLLPSK